MKMKKPQHKCFAFCLFTLIFVTVAFLHTGCKYGGIVSLFGTPGYYEEEIPAEYNLAEHTDRKILVLVNQPGWLNAKANLRYYLTRAINNNLASKVEIPLELLVSYGELFVFRSNRGDFSLLSPEEAGAALNANMVLLVIIEGYELEEMAKTGYYKGFLDVQTVLLDVATGGKLWPEEAKSKSIKVGFEVESRGAEVALARLVAASAHCTVRYLYNCPKNKFKIAEDRSDVVWEDWEK